MPSRHAADIRQVAQKTGRGLDEWCELLEGSDACFAPVLDLDEAPRHPHHVARGTFANVDGVVQPAPANGGAVNGGADQVPAAVPADAGVVSNRMDALLAGVRRFLHDQDEARRAGRAARRAALTRHGLQPFLRAWDSLLEEVAA